MKRLLLTPIFKRFKKSAFFSSLNQNTCPVYDAEEIKKQEQYVIVIFYIHLIGTQTYKINIQTMEKGKDYEQTTL
jgi:hypothetical protein